jgi:hypothetical protein
MTPNNGFVPLDGTKATQVLQARQQSNNPANGPQPAKPGQPKPGQGKPPVNKVAMQNSLTVDMPPMEFLGKLGDTLDTVLATELDNNKVADIRRRMRAGEQIPASQLDLDADGNITGHDGRHRAVAAVLEGREEIPVVVTSPIPTEKAATATPRDLSEESKTAQARLETKANTVLTKLRKKTLTEIKGKVKRGR